MSVATRNPFALLDEDDVQSAPVPTPKEEPAAPAPSRTANQKSRGGPASRGGKYYSRGGKPPSKDATPVTEETEGQKKFDGPREGGRGRGGRGGRGGNRGARGRPFDRHSQTGKTDSEKKVHQGWGGDDGNTELKQESDAAADASAETANNEWGTDAGPDISAWGAPAADTEGAAPADGEAKPEGRPRKEREPEEEDNTLTLDQYLAQKKEKENALLPKLEGTRQANDGVGDVFKDAVALSKNEEEDAYFVGKTKNAHKPRAKKEEKVYLEIDARFERPDRGGRGRGGRGGDRGDRGDRRGGRGRGGGRGGRQNTNGTPNLNVDDENAFPSLS